MAIAHPESFTLQGVTSNYCMKKSGAGDDATTLAVLAEIRVRKTSGRDSPPICGNGFETAKLPFAKGHVIALELGGSDDPGNVVPQFEDWQGKPNGAWRQMEIELMQHHGKMMLVTIGYGRSGGRQDFADLRRLFDSDRLMDWSDERIPDSFQVRVWMNDGVDPSAIATDKDFDGAVAKLGKRGPSYQKDFNLGEAMPQPDRQNFVNQYAVDVAIDAYEIYESTPRPKLARADTPISWMMSLGTMDGIRNELLNAPGVTAPEATGMQAWPVINNWQKTTEAKVVKKHKDHVKKGKKVISEKEVTQGMKRAASSAAKGESPAKKARKEPP
jgi:hypothetical protein